MVLEIFRSARLVHRFLFCFKRPTSILLLLLIFTGCEKKQPQGFLEIQAPRSGSYEIYKVVGRDPLQLVSERIGSFNQPISLNAGPYIILSDCSSHEIIVNPGITNRLVAYEVKFIPPHEVSKADRFKIQCSRHDHPQARQQLVNNFDLLMLKGKWELLVGMTPMKVDLSNPEADGDQNFSYQLSGVRVEGEAESGNQGSFFISPVSSLLAVTQAQRLGHWLYLMPGKYIVELNGSKQEVHLSDASQAESIKVAYLKVETSNKILNSPNLSEPLAVKLNSSHWLDLNHKYPLLPGKVSLQLSNSIKKLFIELKSGELHRQKTKSVYVHLDCPPWDWDCMGSKKIFIYGPKEDHAMATGVTDAPLLYFDDEVWLSVEGSRNIRYRLSAKTADHELYTGRIQLVPNHDYKQGQVTDLVRVETIKSPLFSGNSLDVQLEKSSNMVLITGSYKLAKYVSQGWQDGVRVKKSQSIYVGRNSLQVLRYKVLLPEAKYKSLAAKRLKKQMNRASWNRRASQNGRYRRSRRLILQ